MGILAAIGSRESQHIIDYNDRFFALGDIFKETYCRHLRSAYYLKEFLLRECNIGEFENSR
jgi:hypothetical protein